MSILFIFIGLGLLVIGGDLLVRAAVGLSLKLKLSKMIIGLTVVSFATSAPELLVSVQAAVDGFSDISLGNVIGSNIANIGLVLGLTAIIAPLSIDIYFYKFNWPVMMLLSIGLYFIMQSGNEISSLEGIALVVILIIYLVVLITRVNSRGVNDASKHIDNTLEVVSNFKITLWLLIGAGALYLGSKWLVSGAVDLANTLGVSERVISITMIAIGTSLPELAASVIAALKNQKAYMADMELEYKKGKLDPGPGEKGRKEFLESKLEEMEMSGDKRLMSTDEIEELSNMDLESEMNVAKGLAPKMVERLKLKERFPGLDDELVERILIDDNPQRKAEVIATIEESYKMLEKGMDPEDIINTFKNTSRSKNASGGLPHILGV